MVYVPKQYDSAKAWIGQYPDTRGTSDPMDGMRVRSYDVYDDFYANRPESFKVTLRGNSDTEIYLPSTRKIIDSSARFLGVDFDYTLKGGQTDAVNTLLRNVWAREILKAKFIRAKKYNLIRGDTIWHIIADPNKKPGERLTIDTIHPGCYFPIEDIDDNNRLIGVHLVDLVHDPRDTQNDRAKVVARRLTYRKREGTITSSAGLYEVGGWDDRWLKQQDLKPVSVIWTEKLLHPSITALPVYHIPHNVPDSSTWGTSLVSGVEYLINALNQSITYEDLTLILQGLGLYVTTASPPIDKTTGKPTTYKMRPGNVIEMGQGDTFERVSGVMSVSPYQDHMNFMDKYALDGIGIPDMATGSVDVTVAQSGIALALKMGPIIAENQDKEMNIGGKWDQIGYDLVHGWLPAYEELDSPETVYTTTFGDPMPINRDAVVAEIIQLYTANLILADEARQKLEKLGYDYNSALSQKLLNEAAAKGTAATGDLFTAEGQMQGIAAPPELGNGLGSSVSSGVNGSG